MSAIAAIYFRFVPRLIEIKIGHRRAPPPAPTTNGDKAAERRHRLVAGVDLGQRARGVVDGDELRASSFSFTRSRRMVLCS